LLIIYIDIPYFKEVVIMSTVCDGCGYKSNEVKAGGAVSPQGRRIILNLTDPDDLSRDILKVGNL
jgi:zinc finger protein